MRCSIFLSLRFLLFCFCFLGLQYISMADTPPTAPSGYEYHTTFENGCYDTLNAPSGCKLYFTVGCYWVDYAGDWNEPCLYSNYRGADNNPTPPCWITLPAGNYLIATDYNQQCFVYLPSSATAPILPNPISRSVQQTLFWSWDLTNPQIAESTLPITYSISGAPSWVQLVNGVVCGTCPSGQANFSFTLTATNSVGSSSATVNVTVSGSGPVFADVCKITQTQGTNMNVDLHSFIVSGSTPITITQKTSPPSGLTLSTTGVLSGICNAAGVYNYEVTATNDFGVGNKVLLLRLQVLAQSLLVRLRLCGRFLKIVL
jgi:hypothetical protein